MSQQKVFRSLAEAQKAHPGLVGQSSSKGPRMRKGAKMRLGAIVDRKAALDTKVAQDREIEKQEQYKRFTTEWADKLNFSARNGRLKRSAVRMQEELACANQEIIIIRRERLRALLEGEHTQHCKELDDLGLAILHSDDY